MVFYRAVDGGVKSFRVELIPKEATAVNKVRFEHVIDVPTSRDGSISVGSDFSDEMRHALLSTYREVFY